jgi:hypothetical protein
VSGLTTSFSKSHERLRIWKAATTFFHLISARPFNIEAWIGITGREISEDERQMKNAEMLPQYFGPDSLVKD